MLIRSDHIAFYRTQELYNVSISGQYDTNFVIMLIRSDHIAFLYDWRVIQSRNF